MNAHFLSALDTSSYLLGHSKAMSLLLFFLCISVGWYGNMFLFLRFLSWHTETMYSHMLTVETETHGQPLISNAPRGRHLIQAMQINFCQTILEWFWLDNGWIHAEHWVLLIWNGALNRRLRRQFNPDGDSNSVARWVNSTQPHELSSWQGSIGWLPQSRWTLDCSDQPMVIGDYYQGHKAPLGQIGSSVSMLSSFLYVRVWEFSRWDQNHSNEASFIWYYR